MTTEGGGGVEDAHSVRWGGWVGCKRRRRRTPVRKDEEFSVEHAKC